MRVLDKQEMIELMDKFPDGGIVFADYLLEMRASDLMVTDGKFGAREVIPKDAEVFDFDWNINEYDDSDKFAVYENDDVLQMIQTLTSGLNIKLRDWWEEDEDDEKD